MPSGRLGDVRGRCWRPPPAVPIARGLLRPARRVATAVSAQWRRELDDVVVVVFEEAEAAVDCLEVDRFAEDFDASRPKLGERRVDVGDVQAEVVVLLDAEAVVERVERGVGAAADTWRPSRGWGLKNDGLALRVKTPKRGGPGANPRGLKTGAPGANSDGPENSGPRR